MACAYVCMLQFLVGAVLLLCACPSIYGDLKNSPEVSECLTYYGTADVTATTSWQIINALDLKTNETRSCTIKILWQPVPTQLPVQPSPRMLLLLRIDSVQLWTPDVQCGASTSYLKLYANVPAQASDNICHMSTVTYLWASSNLHMYTIFHPGHVSGSFAVAFVLASATNVCKVNSAQLVVGSEEYVFAPDKRYNMIPPNGEVGCNTSLSIIAANSSWGLVITVLAAPSPDSCRVLCANDTCFSQTASYTAPPGTLVNIIYSSRSCISDGVDKKSFSGFTLKVDVDQQLLSNTSILVIVGLAVAVFVVCFVVLVLVIYRVHKKKSCNIGNSPTPGHCCRLLRRHQGHPGKVAEDSLCRTLGPAGACCGDRASMEHRVLAEVDVHLVDNDLYETSLQA